MASKLTPEAAREKLYGPVLDVSEYVKTYTDGSCYNNGSPDACAGAGVYFGPNNPRNQALRVSGSQTNNRGELLAILYALSRARPWEAVEIYTDSEYAIRSIMYWAVKNEQKGWKCANGDLLKDIVSWIRYRSAAVRFRYVAAHSGNMHNDAADALAKEGA
ncbi:ribonuclease H-like domain-containing protein, partial [Mycena rebaudengoi]